ncbi:hypothetical protein AOLI_G00303000 [Acnodon oligacanthus]
MSVSSACVSWRYPRWPAPPCPISGLLAVPAHRAQTAALACHRCSGQRRNFLEVTSMCLNESHFFTLRGLAALPVSFLQDSFGAEVAQNNKYPIQMDKVYESSILTEEKLEALYLY